MNICIDSIIVAAFIGVFGSIIGGVLVSILTNRTTKKVTERNLNEQRLVIEDSKRIQETKEKELIKIKAIITYNDIINACFEGFIYLKKGKNISISAPNLITINKNYSDDVAVISKLLSIKEISLVFNLYGMIEKIRNDILRSNYLTSTFSDVEKDYEMLVQTVFKDKYDDISKLDADYITNNFLLESMNSEYKRIFAKLMMTIELTSEKKGGSVS